jgi:hypothetical protein
MSPPDGVSAGGSAATADASFTVVIAPDGLLPTVSILKPGADAELPATRVRSGDRGAVRLRPGPSGHEHRQHEVPVDGDKREPRPGGALRGKRSAGHRGDAGTADGPQFGADLDCHQATVEIFPSAGIESGYTLQLEVLDDEGRKGMDKVKVTIVHSNL